MTHTNKIADLKREIENLEQIISENEKMTDAILRQKHLLNNQFNQLLNARLVARGRLNGHKSELQKLEQEVEQDEQLNAERAVD